MASNREIIAAAVKKNEAELGECRTQNGIAEGNLKEAQSALARVKRLRADIGVQLAILEDALTLARSHYSTQHMNADDGKKKLTGVGMEHSRHTDGTVLYRGMGNIALGAESLKNTLTEVLDTYVQRMNEHVGGVSSSTDTAQKQLLDTAEKREEQEALINVTAEAGTDYYNHLMGNANTGE